METRDPESCLASAKIFLQDLGFKTPADIQSEAYWAEVHKDIAEATGRPVTETDLADPMSEAMVDLFFSTPAIAQKFLVADLPRLTQTLVALDTLPGFPDPPQNIAEIGGGPGIASLWLAKKHPAAQCVVYDQSENALAVGRFWAKQLNVTNIRFERTTYDALAKTKPDTPVDLVLGLGALNLMMEVPHLSAGLDPDSIASPNHKSIHRFAHACKSMLAPGGVLYFSQGSFNDLGLLCLFNAFRKSRLGVDWSHTHALGGGKGPEFSIKAIHLFLKQTLSSVFKNAHEDLASLLYAAHMSRFSEKIMVGPGDFETWMGLLSAGTKLADIQATRGDGRRERHTVYVKSGMLGFFSSSSLGGRSGFIYNAAAFESMVNRLKMIVIQYREQGVTLDHVDWHPYFR
jgi:hypothetical protein